MDNLFSFKTNVLIPFLENTNKFQDRNAFCINNTFFTYRDFIECISKIRQILKVLNFSSQIVAVEGNDDLETYASIFALWLEGKSYVPLNPKQPLERSLTVLEQIQTDLILDCSENTRYLGKNVLNTKAIMSDGTIDDTIIDVPESELAYILFTSGSTGVPKGVTATRSNLSAFVDSFLSVGYELSEKDKFLQYCNLTFDISIASYLIPLLKGACVYTVPNNVVKYSYIATLLIKHELTFTYMVPSIIRYLRPYFDELCLPSMRYSLFGGEALPLDLATEWSKCIPNAKIINTAGPTEDTITDIYYEFNREGNNKTYNGNLCIGKPLKNVQMRIIDEHTNDVKTGEIGELCLSGKQLTPGYWKNSEMNQSQFFIEDGIRWYKSGDLCYYDEDRFILISGRLNSYVKIQGFRVELSEIEFYANRFLKNKRTIAVDFENNSGFAEIALFIESSQFDVVELKHHLSDFIPSYMIPTKVLFVERFPLNMNDKVDRNKLKTLIWNEM